MSKKKYFMNFGMDEDVVENVKRELGYIKKSGSFTGEKQNKIYYEKYKVKNEKGRVIISHGFSECIEKYLEVIYYFTREGYSIFIMEHRGHGRSGCLGSNATQVHIEDFNYYINDLKKFIDKVVIKKENLFLFAHSMGGTIGTMFIEKYPTYFKKVILTSPMFKIAIGEIPNSIALFFAKLAIISGKENEFIIGNTPYESSYDFISASTLNESRYNYYYREVVSNAKIQRGGGSYRWLYESLKAIKYILNKNNIKNINIPILLFQGSKDELVGIDGGKKFAKRCSKCKLIIFENANHDIYSENNDILEVYLNNIFEFLKK